MVFRTPLSKKQKMQKPPSIKENKKQTKKRRFRKNSQVSPVNTYDSCLVTQTSPIPFNLNQKPSYSDLEPLSLSEVEIPDHSENFHTCIFEYVFYDDFSAPDFDPYEVNVSEISFKKTLLKN